MVEEDLIKAGVGIEVNESQVDKEISKVVNQFKKKWKTFGKDLEDQLVGALRRVPSKISEFSKISSLKGLKTQLKGLQTEIDVMIKKTTSKIGYEPSLKLFKNKAEVSSEISRLEGLKTSTNAYDIETLNSAIDVLKTKENRFVEAEKSINEALAKNYSQHEKVKAKIEEQTESLEKLKQEYRDLIATGEQTEEVTQKASELKSKITGLDKELRSSNEELNELTKTKKLTSFGRFWNRFKSYATIRVFRNLFSSIERSFSQGIQGLIAFDNQANETISSISSSFDKIKASMTVMAMPLIEIFEPIISSISGAMVDFANNISMASANMKGLGKYTKIDEEYMKDLRSETDKLNTSFDKFESLNGQRSPYKTEKINDEDKEKANEYQEKIEKVQSIFNKLWELIKEITKIALKLFEKIEPHLDNLIRFILLIFDVLAKIVGVVIDIVGWFASWVDTKEELGNLLIIIAGIYAIISAITGNIGGAIAGILGIIGGLGITVGLFADGGLPDKGSLFYAGEAGAELITTGPSGQTGVTNISQFKQAMVEALYECSDIFQQGDGSVVLNLDGAEVARSKRFKAELNRTNSGLNLR